MGHFTFRIASYLMVSILCWPLDGLSAEFTSCRDVLLYLNSARPNDAYARVTELEAAAQVLEQKITDESAECDDFVVERAYFEYGRELEEYSKTFGASQAKKTWAKATTDAYTRYIEWFMSLSDARKDRMIRMLMKLQSPSDEEFRRERGKWLRKRVGNVLNSMGAAYVNAQDHEGLIAAYQRFSEDSVEIFPNEVTRKWHKWLRAKPDFERDKRDSEIERLIAESSDVKEQWTVFRGFLRLFVQANPSVKEDWDGVMRKVSRWLSE